MSAFIKIGDYANGTLIDGDEFTAELENIYNAFNGTSIERELHHKFNGANPGIIIDQLDDGLIVDHRKSGLSICPIGNNGKIVNANVIKRKHVWFLTSILNNPEVLKTFLIPSGTGINIRRISAVMRQRVLPAPETPLSASWFFRKSGSILGAVSFDSVSNNQVDTEYANDLFISAVAGDRITIEQINLGASQWNNIDFISLVLEWEQRLG